MLTDAGAQHQVACLLNEGTGRSIRWRAFCDARQELGPRTRQQPHAKIEWTGAAGIELPVAAQERRAHLLLLAGECLR